MSLVVMDAATPGNLDVTNPELQGELSSIGGDTKLNYYFSDGELGDSRSIKSACGEKTIAFVSGNFNVVHPGHLRLLKFAAEQAEILVVGVNPDNSPGVTVPQQVRIDNVCS